jgi:hypothetical protein
VNNKELTILLGATCILMIVANLALGAATSTMNQRLKKVESILKDKIDVLTK